MSPSECDPTISSCRLSSQQITRASTYALLFLVALTSLLTHARLTWLRFLSTLRDFTFQRWKSSCYWLFFRGAQFEFSSSSTWWNGASTSPPFSNDIAPSTDEYTKPDLSKVELMCATPLCLSPDREESKHIRDAQNDARRHISQVCAVGAGVAGLASFPFATF